MKKLFILLLAFVIALSFAGCGVKEKIENKVGEAIGEKALESISDGKVDISGDKVTIKGDNGAQVTIGTEWPKSDMIKNIPEFKNGKLASVMDSESYCLIIIEEVDEKDFVSYFESLKKDFTTDVYEMKTDEVISFGGGNGKGFNVQVSYEKGSKTLSISASQTEKN